MTKTFVVLAAVTLFFAGCNSDKDTTKFVTDSSAIPTAASTDIAEPVVTDPNQTSPGNSLMASMNTSTAKMQSMQMTGDFDADYANMMIEHHQGALDMAQIELTQGKDEKMKAKAQEILTNQKGDQQKLKDFVNSYKPSGMKHGEGEMHKSMTEMMGKQKAMQMSGDVDMDFAMMMTMHHEQGISMAEMEVKNGMSDKLKQMAKKEINAQKRDIVEFKSWMSGKM